MNSNAGRGFLKAVVIVGFVFAITYFISYNKWLDHDFNSIDISYKTNKNQEGNTEYIKDLTSEYKDIYSKINYEFLEYNFGEEFYDVYYGNKALYDEYFIYVGIINLLKNDMAINCNLQTNINESILKEEIKSIFGEVKYDNKSFTTKNGNVTITYEADSNKYYVTLNGKCSGFDYSKGGIKNVYQKTEAIGDNLYIYDKALYVESVTDQNGNLTFNYHKDINKESTVVATIYEKIDLDLIPTYKYKFVLGNNGYILESISKK